MSKEWTSWKINIEAVEKKKTFGDFTSKTIDTGAVGSRARKGVLNERQPSSSYLPPKGS